MNFYFPRWHKLEERVKLNVYLEKDRDGFPPFRYEGLWVVCVGRNRYRIDNIPFYAPGLSCGDIVSATKIDGNFFLKKIVCRSKNSTIWVACNKSEDINFIRNGIKNIGCDTELSDLGKAAVIIAVSVPVDVSVAALEKFINPFLKNGLIEISYGSIRQ